MSAELLTRVNHSSRGVVRRGRQVRPKFVGSWLVILSIFLLAPGAWTQSTGTSSKISPVRPDPGMKASVRQFYGQLPLSFELNQGQSDGRVKFLSRGQGYALFLTASEAVLSLRTPDNPPEPYRSTRKTSFALPLQKRPTASQA